MQLITTSLTSSTSYSVRLVGPRGLVVARELHANATIPAKAHSTVAHVGGKQPLPDQQERGGSAPSVERVFAIYEGVVHLQERVDYELPHDFRQLVRLGIGRKGHFAVVLVEELGIGRGADCVSDGQCVGNDLVPELRRANSCEIVRNFNGAGRRRVSKTNVIERCKG